MEEVVNGCLEWDLFTSVRRNGHIKHQYTAQHQQVNAASHSQDYTPFTQWAAPPRALNILYALVPENDHTEFINTINSTTL